MSSGTYTYKAYVVDQAGNLNSTEERTFIVNTVPVVSAVLINSTLGTNLTTENLTAYVTSSENDSDGYTLIHDWRKNGISDAVLNMPFNVNGSNGNTSNVKDYTTYSSNGTKIVNATNTGVRWNASCGAFAGSGGCYEFDDIDDYLNIPHNSNLNFGNGGLTFSLWVRTTDVATSTTRTFVSKNYGAGGKGFLLSQYGAGVVLYLNSTSSVFDNWGYLTANTWHYVTIVLDSSSYNATAYKNGAFVSTIHLDEWNITNTEKMVIGATGTSLLMNGSLDQIMLFKRALSASEIAMLYNNGAGMYNRTHSDATTNGDVWYVVVTPADIYEDGTPVASNNVTIASAYTYVNLTSPLDGWYVNNTVKFECFASSNIPLVNVSLWHNNTGTWARNATVTTTATSVIAHYTVTKHGCKECCLDVSGVHC